MQKNILFLCFLAGCGVSMEMPESQNAYYLGEGSSDTVEGSCSVLADNRYSMVAMLSQGDTKCRSETTMPLDVVEGQFNLGNFCQTTKMEYSENYCTLEAEAQCESSSSVSSVAFFLQNSLQS